MLDLEDAVPPDAKARARADGRRRARRAPGVGARQRAAHASSPPRTSTRSAPLAARPPAPQGRSPPRTCSGSSIAAAPGTPLICAIESARGLLAAQEIASGAGVRHLSIGGVDLRRDLNAGDGDAAAAARALAPRRGRRAPRASRRRSTASTRGSTTTTGCATQAELARSLGLLRQVGDPPAPARRPARTSSRRPTTRSPGRARCSRRFAGGGRRRRRAWPAATSSTVPVAEPRTARARAAGAISKPRPHERSARRREHSRSPERPGGWPLRGEGWPYVLVPFIPPAVLLDLRTPRRRRSS